MIKRILFTIVAGFLIFHFVMMYIRQQGEEFYAAKLQAEIQATKAKRLIPETIDAGAYLAGFFAKERRDWKNAANYFGQVLNKDHEYIDLKVEVYLLKLVLGQFDEAVELGRSLDLKQEMNWLVRYPLWADSFIKKNYDMILKSNMPKNELDKVLSAFFKSWAWAAKGNYKASLAALDHIGNEGDLLSLYWYHSGLIHIYFKQPQRADAAFKNLIKTGVSHASVWTVVRHFYEGRGEWNAENPLYKDYSSFVVKNPVLNQMLAELMPKELDTPEKALSEAVYNVSALIGSEEEFAGLVLNAVSLKLNPDYDLVKVLSGEILETLKNYDQATYYYNLINRPSGLIYLKKGLNYQKTGKYEKAASVFQRMISENPRNALLYRLAAESFVGQGKMDLALNYYSQAILNAGKETDLGDLAQMYMARGVLFEALGYSKSAEKDFLQALYISPNDPILLNDVGYRFLEQNREIEKASDMILRAFEKKPRNPYILDSLAFSLYKQKKYEQALPLAEKAFNKLSHSGLVAMHLGDVYLALGRDREALYQYKKALDLGADLTSDQKNHLKKILEEKKSGN